MFNFKYYTERINRIEASIEDEVVREEIFNIARCFFVIVLEKDEEIAKKNEKELKYSLNLMITHLHKQGRTICQTE